MKNRTERLKEKNKQKRKRIQLLSAIAIVFIGGIALGIYWGNVQKKVVEQEKNSVAEVQEDIGQSEEAIEEKQEEQKEAAEEGLSLLEKKLEKMLVSVDGTWSIYVKNLKTQEFLSINNREMYAASLIKLYVMESSYQYMDMLVENGSTYLDKNQTIQDMITKKLKKMISQSDNESYNDLVSLHSANLDFDEGCIWIEEYVKEAGYGDTGIFHTLSPSETEPQSVSDIKNHTSVEDCGKLLEAIYDGTCVSEEASQEMLELLMGQENINKIPQGVPENARTANKTGETEEVQHDAAIVFGEETDYIICVMSTGIKESETAVETIRDISSVTYTFLNNK